MTMRDLLDAIANANVLAASQGKLPDMVEVRVDPDPGMTDQTEQEILSVEELFDEDGREFICLHMRNS